MYEYIHICNAYMHTCINTYIQTYIHTHAISIIAVARRELRQGPLQRHKVLVDGGLDCVCIYIYIYI